MKSLCESPHASLKPAHRNVHCFSILPSEKRRFAGQGKSECNKKGYKRCIHTPESIMILLVSREKGIGRATLKSLNYSYSFFPWKWNQNPFRIYNLMTLTTVQRPKVAFRKVFVVSNIIHKSDYVPISTGRTTFVDGMLYYVWLIRGLYALIRKVIKQ